MRNVRYLFLTLLLPTAALASPTWSSDFESGTLDAWSNVQAVAADRTQIVTDPVRQGEKALKITVRKGDDPINSGNPRAELLRMTLEPEGSEYYYRWSVLFPEGYPSSDKWQLFTQWHQQGLGGTPPLEIYVVGEEIRLRAGGHEGPVLWKAPLVRGQWQDYILHVKWSDDPSVGFVELFHNGKVALPRTPAPTQLPGQLNYMKIGLYRSKEIAPEGVVYFDDVRMGATLQDVMPSEPSRPPPPGSETSTDPEWTSGTVVTDPSSDPDGPGGPIDGEPTPEELASMGGCAAGGPGATSPFALALALAGLAAAGLVRRRRPAKVPVRR